MRAGGRAEDFCLPLEFAKICRVGADKELEPRRLPDVGQIREVAVAVAVVLVRQTRVIIARIADDVAVLLRVNLDAGLRETLEAKRGKARPEVRCPLCCQRLRHKDALVLPVVEHRTVEEDTRCRDGHAAEIARRCFRCAARRDAEVAAARAERFNRSLVRLRHDTAVRDDCAVEVADDHVVSVWFRGFHVSLSFCSDSFKGPA